MILALNNNLAAIPATLKKPLHSVNLRQRSAFSIMELIIYMVVVFVPCRRIVLWSAVFN